MQDKTPQESMAESLAITAKLLREQEQINEQLKSQVEQLSILCLAYEDKLPFPVMSKELFEPIFKAQSLLAEIKKQSFKEGVEACIDAAIDLGFVDNCAKTCDDIRKLTKEKMNNDRF